MRKNELMLRGLVGLSLGLALSLSTPWAHAAAGDATSNAKKKVVVGAFTGAKSDQARKAVIAALKEDGAYDVSESNEAKPGGDEKSFAKASAGASAVLVGTVKKTGLVLSVRNGADGALVQDVEVKGDSPAKLNKNIADTLGLSVADPIAQTKPGAAGAEAAKPEEEEQAPEEQPAADAAAGEAPADPVGHTPLELMAGLRAIHRSFTYHDTPAQLFPARNFPTPQTYNLPLGPAVFIDGTVYPGAWATQGVGSWFGLTGSYELNFATKSVYGVAPNEQKLTTRASQWFLGLKTRIPVAKHEFGFIVGPGQQIFNLLGDEGAPQVPDVYYKFWRLGIEGRLRFDPFSVGFHLGTRFVNATGGLERDWFPGHVKTQHIEMGISGGYTVMPNLEVVAGLDLQRYAFDFNPFPPDADPGSKLIAGGATDIYTSGWLALRYSLPASFGN